MHHGSDDDWPTKSTTPRFTGNGGQGFRGPSFDNTTYMLVLLVVLIPIIFTALLCAITYCIYRYNKKQSDRAPTNSTIVPTDRSGAPIATVIYNTQHSPFIFEDSPPSYDSLREIKKDSRSTTPNISERVQLSVLPPTNSQEEVTNASTLIRPTAPSPPPPSYTNFHPSNQ